MCYTSRIRWSGELNEKVNSNPERLRAILRREIFLFESAVTH
jgi:hypothetical protein